MKRKLTIVGGPLLIGFLQALLLILITLAVSAQQRKQTYAVNVPVRLAVRLGNTAVSGRQAQPAEVVTVSAASYRSAALAPGAIVAAFGANLATTTAVATTQPLPTQLAGSKVKLKDSAGVERLAPLFFVSPGQINYQLPVQMALGAAMVQVQVGNSTIAQGIITVLRVAPAMFTADASGRGAPAGCVFRLKPDGTSSHESLSRTVKTGAVVPQPIDFGAAGDRLFLVLYLTGLQRAALEDVSIIVGGASVPALAVASVTGLVGLEQVNVELPRGLRGRMTLAVIANEFTRFNSGEIEFAVPGLVNSEAERPRVDGLSTLAVLAGSRLKLKGGNFSPYPRDNQVRFIDVEGKVLNAEVETATPTVLRVFVPFGVGAGQVQVSTPLGVSASNPAVSVRTSVSGLVETSALQPLANVTVRVRGTNISVKTNTDGSFVLPDVPAGLMFVIIDGSSVPNSFYPKTTLLLTTTAQRDNQFNQPIRLQQGPMFLQGTGETSTLAWQGGPVQRLAAIAVNGVYQGDNLLLELPAGGTAQCADGAATCTLGLVQLTNSRTPRRFRLAYLVRASRKSRQSARSSLRAANLLFPIGIICWPTVRRRFSSWSRTLIARRSAVLSRQAWRWFPPWTACGNGSQCHP